MIGFIRLFDNSTWLCSSLLHARTYTLMSTVTSSLTVSWSQLPIVDVTPRLGSWTIPGHSYQLLTATAHSSSLTYWLTDRPTNSFTHQPTSSTQLNSLTNCPAYSNESHGEHYFPLLLYPIVAVQLLRLWKHACVWSFYLAMHAVYLLISQSPNSGCTCCSIYAVRQGKEMTTLMAASCNLKMNISVRERFMRTKIKLPSLWH
jgi:hypothetical protein